MKIDRMKIGQLFNIEKGTLQSSKNTPGKYDFITASSDWKTHNEYTHDCEALIFAMGASGSLGRTHYANGKFIASDLCFVLTPKEEYKYSIDLRFYYHYFNSLREEIVKNTATGTSKLAINITNFSNYEIDYYPIEIQRNISRKIDLVIPKINLLEHQIKNTLADINQLKQSILQQAVQGKLVEQDPNGEPAAELLKRIREEKERLIKEKKIKKEKPLPPISPEEIPYELPKGWEWVRLGEIGSWGAGATPNRNNPLFYNGSIPWLKTGELNDAFIFDSEEKITELALEKNSIRLNKPGDVLIAMYGATIGKLGILGIEAATNQACCACTPFSGIYNKYLFYYLMSRREYFQNQGAGGAQPNISKEKIINTLMPLPPTNEQKRIVDKIERLFSICEELERCISTSKHESDLLVQSVLRETFQQEILI